MGLCLKCGTLFADEDFETHKCDEADIPPKGKQKKKGEKVFSDV